MPPLLREDLSDALLDGLPALAQAAGDRLVAEPVGDQLEHLSLPVAEPLEGLAGRVRHGPDDHGHGLWLVNQVCDLVELRSGAAGTMVRMHMRRTV